MGKLTNGEAGSSHAGAYHENNAIEPVRDALAPDHQFTSINSARFLIHKERYPDAVKPVSILNLAMFDDPRIPWISRLILVACIREPGAMVRGATKFITGKFEDEAVEFLVAAGFSQEDAERIAPPGWSFQFSTRYTQRSDEIAGEAP